MQPNIHPSPTTDFYAYIDYLSKYLEPIERGIDIAFSAKRGYLPPNPSKTRMVFKALITYLIPFGLGYRDTSIYAELLVVHLFDVVDRQVPLRSDLLRTLLLAHNREVRIWAIQHASLK
jgi:hypothetical protein